jgi:hypothetical protein
MQRPIDPTRLYSTAQMTGSYALSSPLTRSSYIGICISRRVQVTVVAYCKLSTMRGSSSQTLAFTYETKYGVYLQFI